MITTRPAQPTDIPHLLEGVCRLAAHHDDPCTASAETLARDLFEQGPWMQALVAEQQGQVIGYAMLLRLAQVQFGTRGMDLHHLFVWPAYRQTGAGRALIAAAQSHARAQGCNYLTVGTHPDNAAAETYYLHQGFARRANTPRFAMPL
ncbi:GNAT family N-acetyltransferase [Pseudorhodobacter sp. E13]|uniref:GNAT family N-acetyltransferase n=1 Tax=Pseudorhodobacter sp. E13 TaxID=2487931 RepID=UPI000F8ECA59|nr:GNAT family N-acetyltransferase [Pseudorhodobacter sp. E13]RUS60905.1 GNAT family N-acetyltransferase [Pseudorhodobacter sp. E13]